MWLIPLGLCWRSRESGKLESGTQGRGTHRGRLTGGRQAGEQRKGAWHASGAAHRGLSHRVGKRPETGQGPQPGGDQPCPCLTCVLTGTGLRVMLLRAEYVCCGCASVAGDGRASVPLMDSILALARGRRSELYIAVKIWHWRSGASDERWHL